MSDAEKVEEQPAVEHDRQNDEGDEEVCARTLETNSTMNTRSLIDA